MNSLIQLICAASFLLLTNQACVITDSEHQYDTGCASLKSKADASCTAILDQSVIDEIASYQSDVDTIISTFIEGDLKGKTFDFVAEMTDTFGSRLTGSNALENAIDWMINRGSYYGYDTVHTEPVTAPHWVRNNESLFMISPRVQNFPLLGFGNTIGTAPEGLEAKVLVVTSFDDLDAKSGLAEGRIVVYNVPFTTYGDTVQYRSRGADEASKYGAVASLVRSITPFSIGSPHTGTQTYSGDVPQIPTAGITIEDAQMLYRMQERGQLVTLRLTMGAQNLGTVETRNTILDIQGAISPEEVVLVSGHLDSWDVGVGAMDDGGGALLGFMAGRALKTIGLVPRRTFRSVLFTAEEQGAVGGDAYFMAHRTEADNFQIMMESDFGIFNPLGIGFSGTDVATCMMEEIISLTKSINTTQLISPADTPDLGAFAALRVPRGSLHSESDRYFWFHHSHGDRMEVLDTDAADRVAALWTSVAWVLSDMTERLPH